MKLEAKDLHSALTKASKELKCSVIDLEYTIIQNPKNGFLGFFRKNAIIEVINKKDINKQKNNSNKKYQNSSQSIKSEYLIEIKENIKSLFNTLEDKIVDIKIHENNIEIDIENIDFLSRKNDKKTQALLYLIYNWIILKYKIQSKIKINNICIDQNFNLDEYLSNVIKDVENNGKAQTKALDNISLKTALNRLRIHFPNKYVGICQKGEKKFIIINDFLKKK